ncbi:hypothetical protein DPEC_G00108630 [Dallia pectoralis]|uniref:Uncharacterized protein n=1 Tax=Dallia pectoralis TaxID=75939 RepID=A0ACC2GSQ0_DALPE|nr:hypothetical protein DPEC_G00108630 [Dallia pectoralis]
MYWYNQKTKGCVQLLPSTLTLSVLGVIISSAPLPPTATKPSLTLNSTSLYTLSSQKPASPFTSSPRLPQSSSVPFNNSTSTTIHPASVTTAFTPSRIVRSQLTRTTRHPKTSGAPPPHPPTTNRTGVLKPARPLLPTTHFSTLNQSFSPPLSQTSHAPPPLIARAQIKTSRL